MERSNAWVLENKRLALRYDRLHIGQVLKVRVEVHGIENPENLLADLRTQTRRPPDHLLIEDAAVHAAQEDEVRDCGHINAGCEEINRHGDLRGCVVAVGADQLLHPVHAAGDLLHGSVIDLAIGVRERLLHVFDHDVGVRVRCREDQGLAGQSRIDMPGWDRRAAVEGTFCSTWEPLHGNLSIG